ncbi:S9 family peptidase [uncultured Sphingomonas sp.]|uniref:alpha/beta hydrolase family protein n=1 Tax=uncultured Sphingomonas sp. TaxID=158754 RepID=UPI0025FF164E|nr:S9 family peptidase [uncultured Sphingomonas sp.]
MRSKGFLCAAAAVVAMAAVCPPVEAQEKAASSAPASTSAKIDTAVFAELPAVQRPELSPDGKHVAAKLAIAGAQYFAVMDLDGSNRHIIGAGDTDINWWNWVNDAWLVMGVGREVDVQGDKWRISRVFGVEAATAKLVPLNTPDTGQNGDDVLWTPHDGSTRILLSAQTSIYSDEPGFWPRVDEVDVTNGRHRRVLDGRDEVMDWYADGNGTVRMGVGTSMDGRQRRLLYRPSARDSFRVIDKAKGVNEGLLMPKLFLPDPGKALVVQDDDEGFSALWEYDLTTMQRGKKVFGVAGYDIDGPVVDGRSSTLLGVEVTEKFARTAWLDPAMAALQKKLSDRIQGARVQITSYSADRSVVLLHVGDASAPGAYFLYRAEDDSLQAFSMNNKTLGLRRLHPVKTIQYKARDGLEISAVLTLPRNGTGKNLPLILMPHGGPEARDDESWDFMVQFLADRGYAVIQPNYRGSTGLGTKFLRKGDGQWGLAMQDDLNDAVKALAEQGIADPKRVCVVGASYGGYAALRAAQRDGALFRCAVSYAGVSDLQRMVAYDSKFLGGESIKDFLKSKAQDFKSVSPLFHAQDFSIPVLIVHGKKDRRVPFTQSKVMVDALKSAGKTYEFLEQREADHFFSRADDRLTFLKAMEAFLAKYNPA